jgi:hypothetical protein
MGIRTRNLDEFIFGANLTGVAAAAPTNYEVGLDEGGVSVWRAPFNAIFRAQFFVNAETVTGGGPLVVVLANASDSNAEVSSRASIANTIAVGDKIRLEHNGVVVREGNLLVLRALSGALTGGVFEAAGWLIARRVGNRASF